jgi:ElaB/YqjD/DUF883 family membrane-anchored ribosome-binding protein
MGLFPTKHKKEDVKKEIKEENPPIPNLNSNQNQNTIVPSNNFNNPFANNNNMTGNINQNQSMNSTDYNQNIPQNNMNLNQQATNNPFNNNSQNPFQNNTNNNLSNNNLQNSQIPTNTSNINSQNEVFNQLNSQIPQKDMTREEIQELIDETVEKVIEERWEKLVNSVEKVSKWKDRQESELNLIKDDIMQIKEAFQIMEKKIISKINSYDTNILDVNSEIKALEKVFQKITPTLINNVNELGRIANDLKEVDSNKKSEKSSSEDVK